MTTTIGEANKQQRCLDDFFLVLRLVIGQRTKRGRKNEVGLVPLGAFGEGTTDMIVN